MRVGRHNQEGIVATTQEGLQISAIVPSFTVDDLQKSITFYEALGFAVEERWEEHGTLLGVMLRAGKSQIGLSQTIGRRGATARRESACDCSCRRHRTWTRLRGGPRAPALGSNRSRTIPSGRPERSR
jgi:hypothetical protein